MRKVLLVLVFCGFAASLWAADAFVGTWKMNMAKSKIASGALKSFTMKIEAFDNGLKWTSDFVGTDGKATNGMWSGKYDGKDYSSTGSADYDAIAAKKTNANAFDSVLKKGGKVVGSGQGVVSKDGKTLTLTSKLKNAQGQDTTDVLVFDKQ
jgi:hypothetical protein